VCPDGSAARAVRLRKWLARVVINGCIRDSEEIFKNTVGVKALHTVPKRSAKEGVGERDVPVSFAGTPLPSDTTSTPMLTGS
jgi:regulator of ribonuclease activity A